MLIQLPGGKREIYRRILSRKSFQRKFPRAQEKWEYANWKDPLRLTGTNEWRPRPRHTHHWETSDTKDKKENLKNFQEKKPKIKVGHPQENKNLNEISLQQH